VSAYTYNGLRGASFGPTVGGGSSWGMAHLIGGALIDTLSLGLTITRDREVALRPSFHFPAPLFGTAGCTAQFSVEFQDAERNPIECDLLVPDCSAGCQCWPKTFLNDVSFPQGARWLIIYEDERKLHEERIPDPPGLHILGTEEQKDGVVLQWAPEGPEEGRLWYLVHWLDGDDWRGVAPRQQETSILLPRRLFIESPALLVRVLATAGIATGVAETTVRLDNYQPSEPEISIREALPEEQLPAPLPNVIHAIVRDSGGRQVLTDSMAWFTDDGQQIGLGQSADLRALEFGEHEVRVVVRRLGGQGLMRVWRIERTAQGFVMKQVLPSPQIAEVAEDHPHPHPPGT
jgi:hypothetical protein